MSEEGCISIQDLKTALGPLTGVLSVLWLSVWVLFGRRVDAAAPYGCTTCWTLSW